MADSASVNNSGAGGDPATIPPAPGAPPTPAPGELAQTTSSAPATAPQPPTPAARGDEQLNLPGTNVPKESFGGRVYHGILNALGGSQDVTFERDPQSGTMIAHTATATPGQQWKRMISGALTGFAGAAGPGGAIRGAGAGIRAGYNQAQQQYQQKRQEANEDFEQQQTAALNNARLSMLTHDVAKSTWELTNEQHKADQEDIDRLNTYNQMIQDGGDGTKDIGTFKTFQDAVKFSQQYAEIHNIHAAGRLFVMPDIGPDGKKNGLRAAIVTPDWLNSPTTKDYKFTIQTPGDDGKLHDEVFTLPAGTKNSVAMPFLMKAAADKNKADIDQQNADVKQQLADTRQQLADTKAKLDTKEPGTWQLAEDKDGKPIFYNSKTGDVRDAEGIQRTGTHAKATAGEASEEMAINYGNDYLSNGIFTGSGDEALQEKFFELAKPKTGFRMSQPQMDMLQNSRSWMNSVEAKTRHLTRGTWFSNEQRTQIVQTMRQLAAARQQATGAGGTAPVTQPATLTTSAQPPAGATHKAPGAGNDKNTYWTDDKGKVLGIVAP